MTPVSKRGLKTIRDYAKTSLGLIFRVGFGLGVRRAFAEALSLVVWSLARSLPDCLAAMRWRRTLISRGLTGC